MSSFLIITLLLGYFLVLILISYLTNDKISVNSKVNINAYELVDITGKTIIQKQSKTFGTSFTIDISVLNSGLYFLNVNSNKSNKVIKILKK